MKRKYKVENKDLIKKEKKLRRTNRISNIILIILVVTALIIGCQGYSGKRDSWFFKNVLGAGSQSEDKQSDSVSGEEVQDAEESRESAPDVFKLENKAEGGATNYIFKTESGWDILETGKISGDDVLEIALGEYVGKGDKKVLMITEYYGASGDLMDREEKELTVHVD